MELKHSATRTALRFTPAAPGLAGVDVMASQHPIEPFLVFTEFRMDRPVFGPHPHAGISAMTYILPDSDGGFLNRDSLGDRSQILPGGLHITQAGRGIHHDEVPLVTGVVAHGFQIWVNHREPNRWVEPRAMHADPSDVPEVRRDGASVRVLHGGFAGEAARHEMVTPTTLLHVSLEPHASLTVPAEAMAFAYGLRGSAVSDGADLQPQVLITYGAAGDAVRFEASPAGAEFMFASGTPIGEPLVYDGPFVMTTREQMLETRRRHARGEMGVLH